MAAHKETCADVPNQGLDATELIDASEQPLVLRILRPQVLAGVVRGGVDLADADPFELHGVLLPRCGGPLKKQSSALIALQKGAYLWMAAQWRSWRYFVRCLSSERTGP